MFNHVYLCLLMLDNICLPMFTHVYLCLLVLSLSLPLFTRVYLYLAMFTRFNLCDIAGENQPTGAYFIIEFDLTKVVIGIIGRKLYYDILLLYRSSTIH